MVLRVLLKESVIYLFFLFLSHLITPFFSSVQLSLIDESEERGFYFVLLFFWKFLQYSDKLKQILCDITEEGGCVFLF